MIQGRRRQPPCRRQPGRGRAVSEPSPSGTDARCRVTVASVRRRGHSPPHGTADGRSSFMRMKQRATGTGGRHGLLAALLVLLVATGAIPQPDDRAGITWRAVRIGGGFASPTGNYGTLARRRRLGRREVRGDREWRHDRAQRGRGAMAGGEIQRNGGPPPKRYLGRREVRGGQRRRQDFPQQGRTSLAGGKRPCGPSLWRCVWQRRICCRRVGRQDHAQHRFRRGTLDGSERQPCRWCPVASQRRWLERHALCRGR